MYYKIENQESEVYKKLHELRTREQQMEKENEKTIQEKVELEWTKSLGHFGQQSFSRVSTYSGLAFKQPEKLDPKIWILHKEHEGIYVPNRRTKKGREMAEFLRDLKGSSYSFVYKHLGLEHPEGRFSFPFIEICDQVIIICIDNDIEDENIIEITKKEFYSIHKSHFEKTDP